MAKIKYDVQGVEPSREFDKPIPVGAYKMVISNCQEKESKSSGEPMIELELEVPKGDHKGRKVWDYIVLSDSNDWKLRQLIDSLALKEKGTLDTDKIIGETILVRTKHEPYETTNDEGEKEMRVMSKVASLLKPRDDAEEESEEEEEEESEEETDYSELTMPDLKKELKSRDLPTKGTKQALVKRLEKDDAKDKGSDPF